jgi:hypothetical protein
MLFSARLVVQRADRDARVGCFPLARQRAAGAESSPRSSSAGLNFWNRAPLALLCGLAISPIAGRRSLRHLGAVVGVKGVKVATIADMGGSAFLPTPPLAFPGSIVHEHCRRPRYPSPRCS